METHHIFLSKRLQCKAKNIPPTFTLCEVGDVLGGGGSHDHGDVAVAVLLRDALLDEDRGDGVQEGEVG